MNVPMNTFWHKLPDIIHGIARSHFVAIDLEMTGIEPRRAAKTQKPTMEELYERAKEAAQTFKVVQIGLTSIIYDARGDKYHAQSHNFYVSPMFNSYWDSGGQALARLVDRTLVVSYKTLMFLEKNRIRLEEAYVDGIHYLSRAEESEIVPELFPQGEPRVRDSIDLETQEIETRAFFALTKNKIRLWEENPDSGDYINISNPHGDRLNRFQQRLVYQVLDNEFPGKYRAIVRGNDFMQILHRDNQEEEKFRAKTVLKREHALKAQRGLRYIMEALVGGDFAHGISDLCTPPSDTEEEDDSVRMLMEGCEDTLRDERPVLVGHNMFMDLCFLYATFFGPLPDNLEEFGAIIHDLFPRLVDTKYIATHGGHDMMPAQNLEDLYCEALKQEVPVIDHRKAPYVLEMHPTTSHHAGFDSCMTGVLFVKEMWKRAADSSGTSGRGHPPDSHTLPSWGSEVFQKVANKVRIGNAGILDFGKTRR